MEQAVQRQFRRNRMSLRLFNFQFRFLVEISFFDDQK